MKKIFIIVYLLSVANLSLFAQKEAGDVRRGNREYKGQNFTEAEVNYRRAIETNKDSYEAHYNLGDALFKQDKYAAEYAAKRRSVKSTKKED